MASARAGATDRTVSLGCSASSGAVLVHTISVTSEAVKQTYQGYVSPLLPKD